ncbi:DegT/DnrJ/EryC1/StrS family aminotransferase [Cohaesibacter celericrescens]|uniref:GDP-perosamine synthase n=1 Tax=Cohaesibacter celericrescens TaxID=2067669 RepID=A0A2N5XUM5_9HYPH|nr:DegT/DnrJ/EryC1/StrS family aminotransferase [Cohaesibacter celericrescens]PLW78145.1 aminotransferase [Cohaesibacter celericrescens]
MNDIYAISINAEQSLNEALKQLDATGRGILLITQPDGRFLRTVTDGDVRRFLLNGGSLEEPITALGQRESVWVPEHTSEVDVLTLMDERELDHIPVMDADHKPVALHLRKDIQPRILLSVPHLGELERQYIHEALDTNWVAPVGPNIDAFEAEVAEYVGCDHALAVTSGTAAIHLALRLLDVSHGDFVLCSSFTFVASCNPILYQGATPVFVDSETDTWNMCPIALERAIKACKERGALPKAIIVVHLYGQSARMGPIMELANAYDIPVVEDAAESMGSYHQGKHTGTIGKMGVFSFNGNKIITTSGGGMLVSDDKALIDRARFLATQAKDDAPYYLHSEIGYNYRMSNILAGIGRGQLKVLNQRAQRRRELFDRYMSELKDIKALHWMPELEGDYSNRWLTVCRLDPAHTDIKAQDFIQKLSDLGMEARRAWKPMHSQPLFADAEYFTAANTSYCDDLFEQAICLPSGSSMTDTMQMYVIRAIRSILA